MSATGFILIPFDGGRETLLSASEAKSHRMVDDPLHEARLSELLDQRGLDVKFMFTERGVLMHGSRSQALTVGRLVHDLHALTPTQAPAQAIATPPGAANEAAYAAHITSAFSDATRRFNVGSIRSVFTAAANDEKPTIWGRRPAISGAVRALKAA